ncbi:endocuticle structural protein SgAbd-6 [Drosophila biarmipes]|uniref:endocuticle structural protein SgAbd-6 n=1 Tax=Drosophila biarmipes TaxID=125945 RepID=UPI0007E71197|nr:endocuticle structural protein SgAbd-6 [Drosophila biarmipes]
MKLFCQVLSMAALFAVVSSAALEKGEREEALHFGFHTENGQHRDEAITYTVRPETGKDPKELTTQKPVEYKGGYSFISADGYEYQVLYKANKNGFQPYVTAHKIKPDKS